MDSQSNGKGKGLSPAWRAGITTLVLVVGGVLIANYISIKWMQPKIKQTV